MHNGARDWSFWWCDACVTQPIFFTQDEIQRPQKSCFTCYFLFFSVFSPIFLHAEVVANQPTLLWSWLICMLPFFHTMLHWMSTTESNRDWMQITGLSMERLLILLIFKAVFWKSAKKAPFLQMAFLGYHLVTLSTRFLPFVMMLT